MSDHGRLHGEIPLGYYRVRRTIERLDGFPPELAQAVLHIILSHHGSLAHGSPVVPCTREATLVHMIDNLGGRLGSFDRLEKELPAGQQWSAYDKALGAGRTSRRRPTQSAKPPDKPRQRRATDQRQKTANSVCNPVPTPPPGPPSERPNYSCRGHGQGHREADPPAVADLISDGGTASGDRAGDPARRRGLQRDERGRVRPALLRRPLRARGAAHLPLGREAGRRPGRAGDLLAGARELPPARDRVHRPGTRRAAAPPFTCSTASSPTPSPCASPSSRSPGAAPARCSIARAAHGGARDHRLGRRP